MKRTGLESTDDRQARRLLRWYPTAWRDRYGQDLMVFLEDQYGSEGIPVRAHLSLMAGGVKERARGAGVYGDSVSHAERIRAGALMVLVAWAAFVVAGSSFAKLSEHFGNALGSSSGHVPDVAFGSLRIISAVAAVTVLFGGLVVIPAVMRFLRSGGWRSVCRPAVSALSCTALLVGVTLPLMAWAHHLTHAQRNGGVGWYGVAFLAWGAWVAVTIGMWTLLAVAIARRLSLSRRVLLVEAIFAVVVGATILLMLTAACIWWGTITQEAPWFLYGKSGGSIRMFMNVWLDGTIAAMVVAAVISITGIARISSSIRRIA